MSKTRRKFTREFKVAAVKRLQAGYPVGRVARELEVNPSQLQVWKRQFQERPNSAFSGEGRQRGDETQVAELERKLGQQAMEIGFFKGLLATDRQIEDLRRSQAETANPLSAGKSGKNGKEATR
jgi:transposase-like protein